MQDQVETSRGWLESQKWLLIAIVAIIGFAAAVIIPVKFFLQESSDETYSADREWRSSDLESIQERQQPAILSSQNDQPALLEFYEARTGQLGIPVREFTVYSAQDHPEPFNRVSEYWHEADSAYPYAGRSSVGRGEDDGEGNTPNPVGVLDLQLHPPDSANVTVAAFVVPADGVYIIHDIGVRRVLDSEHSATLRVSVEDNAPLLSLRAASQEWLLNDDVHLLGTLSAGERIFFAVDSDGDYSGDAVEVTWIIASISTSPEDSVSIDSNVPGARVIANGQGIALPAIVPVLDDEAVDIYVPSPQTASGGQTIEFDALSDGSASQQTTATAGDELSIAFEVAESAPVLAYGFEPDEIDTALEFSASDEDVVELTDEFPRSGDQSLKIVTTATHEHEDAAIIYDLPSAVSTVYARFYVAVPRNYYLLDDESHTILSLDRSDGEPGLTVAITDSFEPAVRVRDSTGTLGDPYQVGAELPRDSKWHSVQVRLTIDEVHGQLELWLDGEKLLDRHEIDSGTAGAGDIAGVQLGVIAPRPDNGLTFYLDDLAVSSTYVPQNPVGAFVSDIVAAGFTLPTYAVFAPDGRIFVAQKDGVIRVVRDGQVLPDPLIEIPRVNTWGDRGLISIALDPNFEQNGYLYASYTYDVDPADFEGEKTARISRFTVAGNTADPSSEFILLGSVNGTPEAPSCEDYPRESDCIPSDDKSHSAGNLLFMPDGSLLASLGDGASEEYVDPRSLRAQDLDLLGGKIVRINPANGEGYPDNPFFTGDPSDIRSKVWAYGFRNAFRFVLKPGTSTIYGGDVGWASEEEVDVIVPGENYGWPCVEGNTKSQYMQLDACQDIVATGNLIPPIYAYPHPPGVAVVGGDFYMGDAYPEEYRGAFFFGDYGYSAIWTLKTDDQDALVGEIERFPLLPDGPVQIFSGPDSDLYYLSIFTGELRHIRYVPPPGE